MLRFHMQGSNNNFAAGQGPMIYHIANPTDARDRNSSTNGARHGRTRHGSRPAGDVVTPGGDGPRPRVGGRRVAGGNFWLPKSSTRMPPCVGVTAPLAPTLPALPFSRRCRRVDHLNVAECGKRLDAECSGRLTHRANKVLAPVCHTRRSVEDLLHAPCDPNLDARATWQRWR